MKREDLLAANSRVGLMLTFGAPSLISMEYVTEEMSLDMSILAA